MKRTYIKPSMAVQIIEPYTLMAGSGPQSTAIGVKSFDSDQLYHRDQLTAGGDADDDVTVSSKGHSMWDDDWD